MCEIRRGLDRAVAHGFMHVESQVRPIGSGLRIGQTAQRPTHFEHRTGRFVFQMTRFELEMDYLEFRIVLSELRMDRFDLGTERVELRIEQSEFRIDFLEARIDSPELQIDVSEFRIEFLELRMGRFEHESAGISGVALIYGHQGLINSYSRT